MIKLKLKNGFSLNLDNQMNGFQLLKQLNDEKLKGSIAIKIDDKICDLATNIDKDCSIEFIDKNFSEGLDIIRHSTAHLMANAVKSLYKNALVAIGPSIENGFYYDFDVEKPFSVDDFEAIEKKMNEIIKEDLKFVREEVSREEALKLFKSQGEIYKCELIEGLPEGEVISIYKLGDFVDLCRGPHVPSARYLKYFKLTKVAGAYWKGDSKNKMLQRIYGTAWASKEDLDKYFLILQEAEKRDHKKIVQAMDLMHFEPEYAPGAPFYHPKGLFIFQALISHIRDKQIERGYIEVSTPRIMNRCLWETSGHWQKYGEHNYSGKMEDDSQFCVKPMNCPGGILIYNQGIKSYKDLPIKMAEFGQVNRYESSGSLNGLLRVREFTQDDAHIYCRPDQVEEQIMEATKFYLEIYKDFGFDDVRIKLSTRPENRIGSEEIWDLAEKTLADSLNKLNLKFTIFEGEGAFYGPKLEFVLKDALGRDWQVGTIQVDMNLPERFHISYIGEDGQKHQPIMLHRALLGSIERFMGILIESTEGKFPLWLNPVQAVILNINQNVEDYCNEIYDKFKEEGLRIEKDLSNETLNYKIREYSLKKVPFLIIIGDKEKEGNKITIRTLGSEKQISMDLNEFVSKLKKKVADKSNGFNL
ncbi:MAG TPA: threonine--tRNA ligase [Rickettsiales bacterium]|nr:threonine--tRNA ligase [Rickettsiales bacterium]